MESSEAGFLEHLYEGRFRPELARPEIAAIDEGKIGAFLERYRKAIAEYEPRKLEQAGSLPAELLGRLRETGIFGLLIAREYGGLGFTLSEYLRVIEEMSASDLSLALIPLAHLSIGVKGLLLFGTEEQKSRYLPRAASGEMIFAYALTEPNVGSDAQHVQTTATAEPGGAYLLNGTKTYITNANYAGAFTVFAQLDPERPGRMGAFVVERAWEGVKVGADMPKMGLAASSTAAVMLRDVRVPRENMIGEPGEGFRIAMTILNYGRLGLAAASAGLLRQSLRDMQQRAGSRKQFGVPIREFQLVQEKMVRARAHALAASAMTYFTASLLQRAAVANVALESSHCKLYGTTRCWETLNDALQTAGGSGYLATLPYEKRVRDFRVTTIFEGTTEIHSMYPALTEARRWGKLLQGREGLARLRLLGGLSRAQALGAMQERAPVLREALETARLSERLFRRLLAQGLRRYEGKIVEQEFLLRRLTHLSLSLFWLVATVAYLKARYGGEGAGPAYPQEELDVLAYLIEEARELQARDGRLEDSPLERAHARVFSGL